MYAKIVCDIPAIEIYKEMKEITKVIMATDGGTIQYKGLIEFVLTTADSTVLLSCYGQSCSWTRPVVILPQGL